MSKRDDGKVKIELELSESEIMYLSTTCMQRVLNSALEAVPNDYEHLGDLIDASIYETLRMRICNAVFVQREREIDKLEKKREELLRERNKLRFEKGVKGHDIR